MARLWAWAPARKVPVRIPIKSRRKMLILRRIRWM
ncbi:hypothetical protein M5D96_009487 [Drosophila gunungcola]|uniref:Uncharacterized protein n=1 Tax=Drosophila gunungcola TaxID=103775 RepID=A0A9Q0BM90_9MUSC|nr:hypothetical protein M5D96_009487 [Drosophila gunungcola]